MQLECAITEKCNIREIIKWLDGEGKLILSSSPSCFYEANIINKIDYSSIANIIHEFPLEIELQPIAYGIDEKSIKLTEKQDMIMTQSTYLVKPYIRIYGSGIIKFYINDRTIIINKIEDYIELDCELEEVYKENKNCNADIECLEFPILKPGENNISWSGNVSLVEIKYREAFL